MSITSDIMLYGNWCISVLGFLYWAYQIIRSFLKYWQHEEGGGFDIIMLHTLLFVANFLYLLYEVNVTFTPVYFTMLLFTDITGVWCFLLITQNQGDRKNMMQSKSSWFIDLMVFILIAIYISAYFTPKHYGVRCTQESSPLGSLILCVFYMFWTFYTVRHIRNDPLLAVKKQKMGDLWATTKQLSLHEFEGEFDHDNMVLAQRQMFMITTVINLVIQVCLITWQILTSVFGFSFDDAVKSACKSDWYFQDSNVSMLLNCFMISMPIQQFTSCFYVIPMEHKFFEQTGESMVNAESGVLAMTGIKEIIDGDDIEELDKEEKPQGDDEIQVKATPDHNESIAAKAANEEMAFNAANEDKHEVQVVPKQNQNLVSEALGTEDSVGEIPISEHSARFKDQKNNIRSTKDLRKDI